jgi:amidohydrolase
VAEYDALPNLGHGCGHNLICAAAIAAGTACAELLRHNNLPGQVLVMGTPAEESKGGKVKLLERGCLDGIDAIMMVHPSWRTVPDTGSLAVRRFTIDFTGKSAHAAGAPELGLNALDATVMLYNGISVWRQQLPESTRIHGVVSNGGCMPNIIPDRSTSTYYLRSISDEYLDRMEARFFDIVKGAALITGTEYDIRMFGLPYRPRKPNKIMNGIYLKTAEELGLKPVIPEQSGRGSSDFGNFSQNVPGIHAYFGISDHEIAGHSTDFAEAARSNYGLDQMIKSAIAMAQVGYTFLTDAEIRKKVRDGFLMNNP